MQASVEEWSHTDPESGQVQGKARGGLARAEKLSPEQRSAIAKKAAGVRWLEPLPEAICGSPDQPLRIGDIEIQCYVLDDGTRVLTQADFLEALGRHRKANVRREGQEERVPAILQGKAISTYLTQDILKKSRPIRFRLRSGGRASGYNAELLPDVCDVFLKAREDGVLPSNQLHVAKQAEILVRGLARVGIIALVDEATGYQELRAQNALARILEAFVAKEIQAWVQTFPADFYRELFRLRGLAFPQDTVRRPQYFGHITNDVVYRRLAPGVLAELKRVTLKSECGVPRHKLFQRLTSNHGYPRLREHLGSVVAIMKLSKDWDDFMFKLDRIHPRFGETIPLPLEYADDDGEEAATGI
jgi:hypothetical protein